MPPVAAITQTTIATVAATPAMPRAREACAVRDAAHATTNEQATETATGIAGASRRTMAAAATSAGPAPTASR